MGFERRADGGVTRRRCDESPEVPHRWSRKPLNRPAVFLRDVKNEIWALIGTVSMAFLVLLLKDPSAVEETLFVKHRVKGRSKPALKTALAAI